MKAKVIFLLFISIIIFSCQKEKFSSSEKKFMKTYKEILLARYTIEDSAKANKRVMEILRQNGFTFREFLDFSWELRTKDSKKFSEMIDSIKNEAAKEVVETKKKEFQAR